MVITPWETNMEVCNIHHNIYIYIWFIKVMETDDSLIILIDHDSKPIVGMYINYLIVIMIGYQTLPNYGCYLMVIHVLVNNDPYCAIRYDWVS